MGATVAQCFIAAYPGSVSAFVNVDGMPAPFCHRRKRFEAAGSLYSLYASMVWTGLLRPFLTMAASKLRPLSSAAFPLNIVCAQMNAKNFYSSLASEMGTMLSCADTAQAAWGIDIASLPAETQRSLCNVRPARCGAAECGAANGEWTWRDLPRSPEEMGGVDAQYTSAGAAAALADELRASATMDAPLLAVWQELVVRVLSARNFDFGMGKLAEKFYDGEMRRWAGCEGAMHALLAGDGSRTTFPSCSHTDMFFSIVPLIASTVAEAADEVERRAQR